MTDTTMGGRGGVGIRLFVDGGEVVKRAFGQVADSGKKMWAEIAMGERAANPALRAMGRLSGEAQAAVGGLASRAGAAGNALGAFGVAGVAAGAALGAIALAAAGAAAGMNDAMRAAADLTDTAERIGLGTESLQRLRYVADEAGVGISDLESDMERLNGTFGRFKLGIGDGRIKPIFEELGITKAQLDNIETAEELMLLLADTLGQVQDRASQVRMAEALGVEKTLPLLRLGSEEVRRLADEAENLGFVLSEDVVKQLDASERSLERAGQQMRVIRDTGIAPLTEALADAATWVAGLATEFSNIESHAPRWMQTLIALGRAMPGTGQAQRFGELISARITPDVGRRTGDPNQVIDPDDPALLRQTMAAAAASAAQSGFALRGHAAGRSPATRSAGDTAARDAERRRREQERALEEVTRAEVEASRARLQALYGPGGTVENEYDLQLALVQLEENQAEAEQEKLRKRLEELGLLDDAMKLRLEELDAARNAAAAARDRKILLDEERDLAARRLEAERVSDEHAIDLLSIDEQMAVNARHRATLGRRILILQQQLERKLLAAELEADDKLSPEERARRLGLADERHGREIELFDHTERERQRADFHAYGREVADAIRAGRLGAYMADELRSRLLEMALDGLFDFLHPAAGKAGGGSLWDMGARVLGSLFSPGPGRAGGGDLWRGRRHPVAETGRPELLLIGGKGQVTGAEETARLLRDSLSAGGGANGGRIVVEQHHHNDFRGAVMTEQLVAEFDARSERTRRQAVADALELTSLAAPARQQALRRLGK